MNPFSLKVNYEAAFSQDTFDIRNESFRLPKSLTMEKNCKKIILTGGGYASVWAYRSIVSELFTDIMNGLVKIYLICPEEFHFFHGWTAESFAGIIQDENRMSSLSDIFQFAEIIKGKLSRIDSEAQEVQVHMNDGSILSLPYDQLLLGTGSCDASYIEGSCEYAYQLKSHSAYLRAKNRVHFLVNQASEAGNSEASKILRFVVAGGGFTGVEFAASLAELIGVMLKNNPALRDVKPIIYLVNSKEDLLAGIEPGFKTMKRYAEKTLNQYGIKIIHQSKITRVTQQGVFLDNGHFIESKMVVLTVGQCRLLLSGTEKMERNYENRILTNRFLQINNCDCIWGAGDAVLVNHPKTGKPCPTNALWAIKQGEQAGKNIARTILNQPLKSFSFKGLGQCASLGIGKGVGELYGIQLTGWIAWVIRWFFFQYFMPLRTVMWREISDWLFLLFTRKRRHLEINNSVDGTLSHLKPYGYFVQNN